MIIEKTPDATPLKDILTETPFVYSIEHLKKRYKITLTRAILSYENVNATEWQSFNLPYGLIILYRYLLYHTIVFQVCGSYQLQS